MSHVLTITFLFLTAMVGMTSGATVDGDDPPFRITTKRDSDKVEVKVENDKTVFSVHSPLGISETAIERTDEKWPDTVVLRLHLKGLESFRASNAKVTLHAAVSSQDKPQRVRFWKDGKEDSPLDKGSVYWMEIRLVSRDLKPATTIPLKDGYFEMQLPKAFFKDNPKSIKFNWVDFYRN